MATNAIGTNNKMITLKMVITFPLISQVCLATRCQISRKEGQG